MNTEAFNRMLRSARDLLAKYHEGVTFDPATVHWAQELTAANPTDKRRSSPLRDSVLALFEADPSRKTAGMTSGEMAGLVGMTVKELAANLFHMVHGACPVLWAHRPRGARWAQHFDSKTARDAFSAKAAEAERAEQARQQVAAAAKRKAREAARAVLAARAQRREAREQRRAEAAAAPPKLKIPRLATVKSPRQAKPSKPKPAPKTGAEMLAAVVSRKNGRVNPDQGGKHQQKPPAGNVEIPADFPIQRGEPYTHDPRYQVGPNERPFGAGFAAVGIGRSPVTGKAWE